MPFTRAGHIARKAPDNTDKRIPSGSNLMTGTSTPRIHQQVTWVYTQDLEATAPFYEDTLGLPLVLDQDACRIYRSSASSFLGLCRARPGREVEPRGVVLTLVTPDVDSWHIHLLAAGAPLEGAPVRSERFNVYSFFTRDPNGYRIEFQQFLDPAWPTAVSAPDA
jgi:catechol 2,3-dioxygenase-like lactoylglutathione lyase family enzyme